MADIVQSYIGECSIRNVEPYYAILENIHQGVIHADIDFIALPSLRVWMHCLTSFPSSGKKSSKSSAPPILGTLSFQQGVNKDKHHPPVKSNTLVSYSKLLTKYKPLELTTIAGGLGLKLAGAMSNTMRLYSHSLTVVRLRGVCLSTATTAASGVAQQRSPCNAEIERFVAALPFLIQLTLLDISDSAIGDNAIEGVAQAVCQLTKLDELHLAGCALSDVSSSPISAMITSNAAKFANSSFLDNLRGDMLPRASGARNNSRGLRVLNIARNLLGDKTAAKVGIALGRDEVLESLLMSNNAMTTKGLLALFGFASTFHPDQLDEKKQAALAPDGSFLSSSSRLAFLDVSSNPCASDASTVGMLCSVAAAQGYCATAGLYQAQFVLTRQQKMINNASKFELVSPSESEGKARHRPSAALRRNPSPLGKSPDDRDEATTPSRTPLAKKKNSDEEAPLPSQSQQQQPQQQQGFTMPYPFWPPAAPSSATQGATAPPVQFVPFPMFFPVMGMPGGQWPQFANNTAACPECSQRQRNHNGVEDPTAAQPTSAEDKDELGVQPVDGLSAGNLDGKDEGVAIEEEERPLEVHDLLAEAVLTSDSGDCGADAANEPIESPSQPTEKDAVGKGEFERFKETVLQSMMVQEETTAASNEQLRGELRRSNQRVEELSSIVHNALQSVDKTAEALSKERAAFLEAKRVQDEWLQTHPEDAIAQDVVSLIHTGIDRIRSLVNPPKSDGTAAPDLSRLPPSSKLGTNTSTTFPLRSSNSNIVNSFDRNKKQDDRQVLAQVQHSEGPPPSLQKYLGDVKNRLSILGW